MPIISPQLAALLGQQLQGGGPGPSTAPPNAIGPGPAPDPQFFGPPIQAGAEPPVSAGDARTGGQHLIGGQPGPIWLQPPGGGGGSGFQWPNSLRDLIAMARHNGGGFAGGQPVTPSGLPHWMTNGGDGREHPGQMPPGGIGGGQFYGPPIQAGAETAGTAAGHAGIAPTPFTMPSQGLGGNVIAPRVLRPRGGRGFGDRFG